MEALFQGGPDKEDRSADDQSQDSQDGLKPRKFRDQGDAPQQDNDPGEAQGDGEGLHTMRVLGRNMAWMLKCIEAGRAAGINPPELEPKVMTNVVREDLLEG